jgi:hypothetical protein
MASRQTDPTRQLRARWSDIADAYHKTIRMTPTSEFPQLLELALSEIQAGTRELVERYSLANFPAYELDLRNARLGFADGDKRLYVPIQVLGVHHADANEWQWAWDDAAVPDRLTRSAREALAWGRANEIAQLVNPRVPANPDACWRFAAFAARLTGWTALYSVPSLGRTTFLAFGIPA